LIGIAEVALGCIKDFSEPKYDLERGYLLSFGLSVFIQ